MSSTTIAVDLAKNVFELAIATPTFRIVERKRVTRSQFERCGRRANAAAW